MRKLGRLLVLLFAVLVAGTGAAFAIGGAKPPPKVVKIVNASSSCAEFCFRPAQLRVPLNTAVTWKNTSISIHTVTRCTKAACAGNNGGTGTDKGPNSGTVSPGKSYTFVFKHKGTYTYYCQVHGFTVMHGTITVG